MSNETLVLTVTELCKELGISRSGFYLLQKKGGGPRLTRLGGRNVILRTTALEWLRDLEKASQPSDPIPPFVEPPGMEMQDLLDEVVEWRDRGRY